MEGSADVHHVDQKLHHNPPPEQHDTAPYEAFYGVKPDIGDVHLWGSRVWVRDLTAGKLDPRGREGCFVGYDTESKGCRIYWLSSRSIGVECDLIFEDRPVNSELIFLPDSSPTKKRLPAPPAVTPEVTEPPPEVAEPPSTQPTPEDVPSDEPTNPEVPPAQVIEPEPPAEAEPPPRQSGRIHKPSRYVHEALKGTIDGGTARGKSRLPTGVQVPTGMTADLKLELELRDEATACLTNENRVIEVAMASVDLEIADNDPKSLAEAMACLDWPDWKVAMDEEIALMTKYKVWEEVDKPDDTNIIGSRWVFRIKRDANGKVLKYRARLVAQGFTQLHGVDFQETFAPVAHLSSIRTVITLAASEDWELHQMDVKSAYLNSPIDAAFHLVMAAKARLLLSRRVSTDFAKVVTSGIRHSPQRSTNSNSPVRLSTMVYFTTMTMKVPPLFTPRRMTLRSQEHLLRES